jgi:hypothetical protein
LQQLSHAVAIADGGKVAIAGRYTGTVELGGPPLPAAFADDIFIGVFDGGGAPLWSKGFGGTGNEIGWGVAFDGAGNVVLVGDITGEADFGGGELVSIGQTDVFAAKFDAGGTELWSHLYGNAPVQHAEAVTVGGNLHVWLVGSFDGKLAFGDTPELENTKFGPADAFFARLTP